MIATKEMLASVPFQYAAAVKAGDVVAGEFIKLAIDRFYKWVDSADTSTRIKDELIVEAAGDGFTLDHNFGMHIINFFHNFLTYTKHPDKHQIGQPFKLSPFQQFTLYNTFGWLYSNTGYRRINEVYEKMAKKNGKTAVMAGVLLYHLAFDGVQEAQGHIGATKEEQAKLCMNQAMSFIQHSAALRKIGFITRLNKIIFPKTGSFARALGGDSKTQDGIDSSLNIIDEYHAHKDDSVKENLESSSVSRTQPITWHITTAGVNLFCSCKLYEDSCKDILRGVLPEDQNRLIMIHDLDESDDWEKAENWAKANPNLGVSVNSDSLNKFYNKALLQPSKIPNFKTKHLNIWVDNAAVRIPDKIFMLNADKPKLDNFRKYGCGGGLDLSSSTDLSAYVLVSNPDPKGYRDILPFHFCPKDTVDKRSKEDRVPYRYWADLALVDYVDLPDHQESLYKYIFDQKVLTATPGNQIDYNEIEKIILRTYWLHNLKWIDYDKYKSTELVQKLVKQDVEMVPFSQTVTYYSFPTKEFERLMYLGKIRHGGNPILRWSMGKVKTFVNNNEDIRYIKQDHNNRIDGIIASIMGLSATISEAETNESAYNDPGTEISFGL